MRAGGQAALQHREGEADGAGAGVVAAESLSAVHFFPDVAGDFVVEVLLAVGKLVGHGFGDAFGEQRFAFEGQQLLLTMRRISPVVSVVWAPERYSPSKRSGSSRAMKAWKLDSLPAWGWRSSAADGG